MSKRDELLKKMIACFDTCTLDMSYSIETAMDRVLELVEEELDIELDTKKPDDDDDDRYCGAV